MDQSNLPRVPAKLREVLKTDLIVANYQQSFERPEIHDILANSRKISSNVYYVDPFLKVQRVDAVMQAVRRIMDNAYVAGPVTNWTVKFLAEKVLEKKQQ